MISAHPTRTARRLVTSALALVTAAGLAACTSSGSPVKQSASPSKAGSTSAAAPTVSAPPKFSGTKHALPTGAATRNNPSLYKNVALAGCAATAHGWKATGTAKNTNSKAIDIAVLVLFTDAQARDVDSATTTVHVPAGTTAHWTATRRFPAPRSVRCVLRAVHAG